MILENYMQTDSIVDDVELQASDEFVGDAGELAELTIGSMTEMHNLTIAMARVEHKCLVENNQEMLEEGVKEFFSSAIETIKKYWQRFIAWLGSMWTKLKDVFVKRQDWLKRNASVITGVSDEQLKDVKVKIGKEVANSDFSGSAAKSIGEAKAVIAEAQRVQGGADTRGIIEKAKAKLLSALAKRDAKKSTSKNIHDSLIGESEEVALTKSLVAKLVKVAEDTFRAVEQMKGAKIVADAAMKEAEGMARVEGGDKEAINARLAYLRSIGSEVQTVISSYASAIGTANGQVMPVLVRVAGLAGGKKKDEAPAEAKQENSGLLVAFM